MPQSWRWSHYSERAAFRLAEDTLTDEQIAQECRINRRTLERWKRYPQFQARIAEHLTTFREKLVVKGIAERQNRVDALNARWRLMQQVIDERAQAHDGDAPGSGTGLLVRQEKVIGAGEAARDVVEWQVDGGLLAELRAHEKQAAQELQQWVERGRQEVSGPGGAPLQVVIREMVVELPPSSDGGTGEAGEESLAIP